MTFYPRSVRVRMTFWFCVTLALIILAFSVGIYLFVQANLLRQVNRQLGKDLAIATKAVREDVDEVSEIEEYGIGLARVGGGDRTIYRTEGWRRAELDKALKRIGGGTDKKRKRSHPSWSWSSDGRSYRLMADTVASSGRTFSIVVAQDERSVRQSLKTLALMLLIGFPCALCLATIGGYFLAGRLLSPVGAMATKAQEITADRLSERLPVHNPDDEFGRLATVFNSTLARLENSFEQLRRFTADASHELRTPLTAIRSVGEVALQEPLDPAACRDVIGSMLEEADRLTRLVDSLLVLTRADSGRVKLAREPLDLTSLVNDVSDCLGVLAEEKKQALSVEIADQLIVEADRDTLRSALINILDNAIKYTPAEGHIRIVVKRRQDEAVVEVGDDGPGIPLEHREKIFERFYRVEKARSSETGGAGLGLAIARWAVEINGGRIELESEEGRGSTFRVILTERKEE
jgi:heavy metal sensor kinase